jgi:hypothetical protein
MTVLWRWVLSLGAVFGGAELSRCVIDRGIVASRSVEAGAVGLSNMR